MDEKLPKPESQETITREQVIEAYKKFVEQGITSPDSLDLENPEVIAANDLFDKWVNQEDTASEDDQDAELRNNFRKTMFYVDAGFTDPAYLNDVMQWLAVDTSDAEKDTSNPARVQLRHDMAEAKIRIRKLLKTS